MIEKELSRTVLSGLIDEWILHERNRKIVYRRMIDGICYEPLAEEFGMSVRQIKTIVKNAEKTILNHI